MGKKKIVRKKDDNLTKDVELALVSVGYKGKIPIECRPAAKWLEKNYPKSVIGGYAGRHAGWREDLLENACKKYPVQYDKNRTNFYEMRNEIIRLAIEEIKNKKRKKKSVKSIHEEIEGEVKIFSSASVRGGFRHDAIADRKIVINKLQQILDGTYFKEDISYSAKVEALIGELKESIK